MITLRPIAGFIILLQVTFIAGIPFDYIPEEWYDKLDKSRHIYPDVTPCYDHIPVDKEDFEFTNYLRINYNYHCISSENSSISCHKLCLLRQYSFITALFTDTSKTFTISKFGSVIFPISLKLLGINVQRRWRNPRRRRKILREQDKFKRWLRKERVAQTWLNTEYNSAFGEDVTDARLDMQVQTCSKYAFRVGVNEECEEFDKIKRKKLKMLVSCVDRALKC